MKPSKLKRELLKSKNFIASSKYLEDCAHYVVNDLKSPRIRTTNAAVMSLLTQSQSIQLNPEMWDETKVKILWGDMDKAHYIPKSYEPNYSNSIRSSISHRTSRTNGPLDSSDFESLKRDQTPMSSFGYGLLRPALNTTI